MPEKVPARILLQTNKRKGLFMMRLFGGATLLCAAFSAHAGLIRADFSTGFRTDFHTAGDGLDGNTYLPNELLNALSNGSGWESGEAWLHLDPAANMLALQAQEQVDFQAPGSTVTGIAFLAEPPAEDGPPIPEPETLALLGLGAGALGLARQGKNKRV
jgi:hypothetical protein